MCVVRIADCRGQVCVDTSVTIAKTMSVIVIEGCSVANNSCLNSNLCGYCLSAEHVVGMVKIVIFHQILQVHVVIITFNMCWFEQTPQFLSAEPSNSIWSTQLAGVGRGLNIGGTDYQEPGVTKGGLWIASRLL